MDDITCDSIFAAVNCLSDRCAIPFAAVQGMLDSEIGTGNQDDFLPPLVRLQKFASSDAVFDR
jgi:hypothetical protein